MKKSNLIMDPYNPQEIEKKWQQYWEEKKFYQAEDFSKDQKQYLLLEFPYPSGDGLHVGHCRPYCALDAVARQKRMAGANVLFPIGWDAFGLPTENYAIKHGIHPSIATEKNIANFKRQLKSLGLSFDWSREINTADPKYYKWTQWIFLKLFEKGLAYQAEIPINWCLSCKIGLANEEVVAGVCERCGAMVVRKTQKQWMLKITAYADRLIDDLEKLDFPERVKSQQINWIGKSFGTEVNFPIVGFQSSISVFTTRIDTLFGVTAVVLAPEHPLVEKLVTEENKDKVKNYIENAKKKSDFEREKLEKGSKSGVFTGSFCKHPLTNEKIPIWIGDYVISAYGGGAVMMVPEHDKRDYDFAKKYGIKVVQAIVPMFEDKEGGDKIKDGIKIEKRKNVLVIIKHWKEDKIYCLDWDKIGWKSFIVGGVEEGENYEAAAIREAKEESGYQNIKSIKKIGGETHGRYFLPHKNVNRYGINECYYIELADEKHVNPTIEETINHKGAWIPIGQVKNYINLDNNLYYWDIFQNGEKAFVEYGILINSSKFDGLKSKEAIEKITKELEKKKLGRKTIQYKLRDWVFSRQHYWGEPMPIIHCQKCGIVPVPEKDLPVELPYIEKYQPSHTGESPLSAIADWVNVKCPKCGGLAKRETDTMPNWAGSNWYFMRYCDPQNDKALADKKKLKYWLPVDWYNGGMEHTTLHLLYSRFIYKFLFDIGAAPTSEPYQRRTSHGIVLAEDGRKMSKSFGNVVNPDDIINNYGADTLRVYEMFMGPFDQAIAWSEDGVKGVARFLEKVWKLSLGCADKEKSSPEVSRALHALNKKINEELETMKFNTIIAGFMEFTNFIQSHQESIGKDAIEKMLVLLSPFAPHLAEELWQKLGHQESIFMEKWPEYSEKMLKRDTITLVIQINGRVRDTIEVKAGISENEAKELTLSQKKVKIYILDKEIKRVIFVPGKLINIVI